MKGPRLCAEFVPDPDIPADHRGFHTCRTCHRLGKPDDPGHTRPPLPAPKQLSPALAAAAQAWDAAVLGEHDREENR